MEYEKITMVGDTANLRYLLKKDGIRPLVIIGVNPSKATDKQSDRTMTKVMHFAEHNDFDGFIMLNIYPQRSTDPKKLDKFLNPVFHNENLNQIKQAIQTLNQPTVLCAFGDTISVRPYLKDCLRDIINVLSQVHPIWKQIGKPTAQGNPRHPSRAAYGLFSDFDIIAYIK